MNILINSPSLNPNINVSGISSVTRFIINNNKVNNYIHFTIGRGDNEHRNIYWLFNYILSLIKWSDMIASKKIELVHFNFPLSKLAIIRDTFYLIISMLFKKKMIIHIHGGEYLFSNKRPFVFELLLSIVFKMRIPIITLSDLEKNKIIADYNSIFVFSLPNCVEQNNNFIFKKNNKILKILFIGRITNSKGIYYLLSGLEILYNIGIDFKFIVAGKGNKMYEYNYNAKKILNRKFLYAGVVSGTEKTNLIKSCDIFILPSIYGEGLPIALLECMSYGLVPIVTDDGSMSTVVKHLVNGIIIRKCSAEDICYNIKLLNDNRLLLSKLGHEAGQTIYSNFNPVKYISKLNWIYDQA